MIVDDAVLVWVVHDTNPHVLSPKVKSFVQAQALVPGPHTRSGWSRPDRFVARMERSEIRVLHYAA